ncbi:hypothetical protein ALON55S_08545 [Alishewanella longhuensis]
MFDCLMRASEGHVPVVFYQNDIRMILDFLGENIGAQEDTINVVAVISRRCPILCRARVS